MSTGVKFEMVPIDKLVVDERYQRPIYDPLVTKICQQFDPRLVGTIEVSRRGDGTNAVFDGQHRLEAMKLLGFDEAPCIVHDGMSTSDEAGLFVRLQRERRPVRPVERFRAQVFSGDAGAVALNNVIVDAGYRVGQASGRPGVIRGVISMERIYRTRGAANLTRTLQEIKAIWFEDRGAMESQLIEGMSLFLDEYGDKYGGPEREILRRSAPVDIVRRARGQHPNGGSGAFVAEIANQIRLTCKIRRRSQRRSTGNAE